MAFETEGTVHKIFDSEKKTDTFRAREFVIKQEGQYPQFVKFQLTQDRCDIIDGFNEGDKLKVFFDLRGREWNDKYFTNLNAWKVEKLSEEVPASGPDASFETLEEPNFEMSSSEKTPEEFDDLPF